MNKNKDKNLRKNYVSPKIILKKNFIDVILASGYMDAIDWDPKDLPVDAFNTED